MPKILSGLSGNWIHLSSEFHKGEVKDAILSLKPTLVTGVHDSWTWHHCCTGVYSTKSAYKWLMREEWSDISDRHWSWIWKTKLPSNIQFFTWQCCHAALPTRDTLARRGINVNPSCIGCGESQESITHCLFTCPRASPVWGACWEGNITVPNQEVEISKWLHANVNMKGNGILIIMWQIWLVRNSLNFDGVRVPTATTIAKVKAMTRDVDCAYGHNTELPDRLRPHEISWTCPVEGQVTLNVDGSAVTNPGLAGYGGLVRDHTGKFLHGFYGSVGVSDIMHAELMALSNGIKLCWSLGFRRVACYSDSMHIIKLIEEGDIHFHRLGNHIAIISELLQRNWDFQVHHTLRE